MCREYILRDLSTSVLWSSGLNMSVFIFIFGWSKSPPCKKTNGLTIMYQTMKFIRNKSLLRPAVDLLRLHDTRGLDNGFIKNKINKKDNKLIDFSSLNVYALVFSTMVVHNCAALTAAGFFNIISYSICIKALISLVTGSITESIWRYPSDLFLWTM